MDKMHIFLLGQPRIVLPNAPAAVKFTRAGLSLFAYLLLQPHQLIPRERILGLFWGEHSESRARSCLNSALWRLRTTLATVSCDAGRYVVSTEDGQVGFNWESDYWFDVERFDQVSALLRIPPAAMTPAQVEQLETTCHCYTGELLEGFYEDWALRERERLRRLHLNGLAQLMHYYTDHKEYAYSLSYGQQILALDPLREEIHRAMIRLYLQTGQRTKAIQQYDHCRAVIADELGVEPMEETQFLYAQMTGVTFSRALDGAAQPSPIDFQQALRELKLARKWLDQASTQLGRTINLLEQYTDNAPSAGKSAGKPR
ncbi:MAG: hypothetical protein DYG89_48270 [Caldilinea sp. CFX5]|nr:hypothetical protein [Caldilinea sp. CFX5]